MLRTTLAGLKLHKSRYVTTVLAILLGVMFVSGTMVFADTLNASYEESVMGSATSVDAIAVPSQPEPGSEGAPEEPIPFTGEQLDDVRALPEVSEAGGLLRSEAVLLDADGRAVGFTPPAAVGLEGVSRFSADEGSLPSNGDEIALATSTADQTGFAVGDTVTVLDAEEEKRDFTVTGLVEFGVDPSYSFGGAVVFDPDTVREMTGVTGYSEIDARAAEGHTPQEAADSVTATLGSGAEVRTGEEYGLAMAENVGGQTEMMRVALLLFAFIAMFVAGIVIYNTFAILIAQRQRELALLRCMGAKRGQVFRSVLAESVVVGLVASALGVLAGVGIGMAGATFGGPLLGTGDAVPVVVTPLAVVVGLAVGTVVTVFSALIPATRATRVAPLAALRTSATAAGLEKGTGWIRVVFGLLTFAVSAGLVAVTQMADLAQVGLVVVTAAALITFVGVVVLGPLLVRGIVRLVGVPLRKVGVPSMLAVDNSTRSPRRAATAMIALTVGATLITGYSVISASTEATMTTMLEEQFPVDYQISPQFSMEEPESEEAGEPQEASAEGSEGAGNTEGAEGAESPADGAEGSAEADGAEGTGGEPADQEGGAGEAPETPVMPTVPAEVVAALESQPELGQVFGRRSATVETDDDRMAFVYTYPGAEIGADLTSDVVEGDLADMGPGRAVVAEGHLDGVGVGDTATLPSENGEDLSLEVVAVVEEMQMLSGVTVAEEDFAKAFPEVDGNEMLFVRAAEGADPAEVRDAVYTAVEDHPTMQVGSAAEMKNQFSQILDIAFYTIAAMLGLAIIIAVFGISNTMALSVLERTRESALLRALGLARGQLRRMLSVEAVLLCLIGAGIGIVLGVVFGWAAGASVLPNMIFAVPVGQIAMFIAVAVLAGLLASVLPGRRAAGTSITGALASE
ncbi:putative ABC transport system permease protein [Nocardiopsis arvandica]|uniref:Putative ABC transport system permease protein n=1 Tax=Nocardiopsis sinuspersici TaxID=501010 RepID=A0A7Y9X8Q9_9ACTN|nr:ABC transporter permease [Nocardiopsis sinuspersici]NYH50502.1 putative ABC transport system permease protein [Nocardiopsis sinuspersici]